MLPGLTVNLPARAYAGSNPALSTSLRSLRELRLASRPETPKARRLSAETCRAQGRADHHIYGPLMGLHSTRLALFPIQVCARNLPQCGELSARPPLPAGRGVLRF